MKFLKWNKVLSFCFSEWQKKLIAVLLAAFLWYYVNSLSLIEQTFNQTIQFRNLPPDMVLLDSSDTSAAFVVRGRAETLKNVNFGKSIKLAVNLEDAKPGTNSYKIELNQNEPQPDLIINLQNDRVRLWIDRISTKTVTVQPVVNGTPFEGYVVDDVMLDRASVTVRGPAELLAAMEYVQTLPIEVGGASNDITASVGFDLPKQVVPMTAERVNVSVNIIPKEKKTELEN